MKPRMGFLAKWLCVFFVASAFFYLSVLNSTKSKRELDVTELPPVYATQESETQLNSPIVTIAVYYETKCTDSSKFITQQVSRLIDLMPDVVNVVLVPYGNANYTWNETANLWKFQCQHGPDECYGNLIHNCLIFLRPNLRDHFTFINCSMRHVKDLSRDVSIECANMTENLPFDAIIECAQSKMGNNLLYSSALLTDRLRPVKAYVPWVVIDGVHTDEIQERAEKDLLQLICDSYKGPKKLDACL